MEFTQYKCPVCDKQFGKDDDVVVCPECGAPHHRECYENNGECFYEDKHSEDFSFEEINNNFNSSTENTGDSDTENSEDTIECPNCKFENPRATFYCNKCGFPLTEQDRKNTNTQNTQNNQQPFEQGNMPPFGFGGTPVMPFDPLAGLKNDQPVAENVTAGEMAKFVGKSTQYFLTVFNNITNHNNSRFNFSAFLFSGFYFLYRKMNVLGVIFSLLIIGLTVGEVFVQLMPGYNELFNYIANSQNGISSFTQIFYTTALTTNEKLFFFAPFVLSGLKTIVSIICGAIANRSYYKHCTKKINSIKKKSDSANLNKELETKGGVNFPLAVSFAVAYIIVTYIPYFL